MRHTQVSLRDFDIGGGSRHALSLVGLFTEEPGFLHPSSASVEKRGPHEGGR
jgi:hypothetical protein